MSCLNKKIQQCENGRNYSRWSHSENNNHLLHQEIRIFIQALSGRDFDFGGQWNNCEI